MAGIKESKVQIDPFDPLFLHPSDHPGQTLVTDIFGGEDFDNWKRSVKIALSAKHKISFIEGTSEKPDSSSPLLPYWQRCNDMVLSWLLNSVQKPIRDSVIFCETAKQVWKELNERYGQSNKARHFQAQKEVSCITQGDLDIASFFNKAKRIWDEFTVASNIPWCTCKKCECDINLRLQTYLEEQKTIQFLMGLNDSYTAIRGNILMMSPAPSLSQVYSLLVQEERQRQVKTGSNFPSDNTAFNAVAGNNQRSLGPRKTDSRRSHLFCDHCKRTGHTIERCFKIHGYPVNSNGALGKGGKTSTYNRQGFKGAHSAWGEAERQRTDQPVAIPGLSQEQSKKLIHFISNLTSQTESRDTEVSDNTAHMAGPFSEEATGHW